MVGSSQRARPFACARQVDIDREPAAVAHRDVWEEGFGGSANSGGRVAR